MRLHQGVGVAAPTACHGFLMCAAAAGRLLFPIAAQGRGRGVGARPNPRLHMEYKPAARYETPGRPAQGRPSDILARVPRP